MRTFTATKVHYTENERDKDGDLKTYITSEEAFNKALKRATDAKEELPTLIASQTFQYSAAETIEEAMQLAGMTDLNGDPSIFLSVFNETAGILKQHNEAADLIRSDNFQPVEGALDLAYAVAQKSEGRQKMSNEDKAAKALGVTADQLRAALALLSQQAATQSASA